MSLLAEVDDPRRLQARHHDMEAILLIATLAVICGEDNWTEVEFFGLQKQAWLETFLDLPHGIPSHDQARRGSPLHLVRAWADEARLVLGQRQVDDRSNEITAIPALLETLALEGCIVAMDAMGSQKRIAETIRDRGADYVLALKGNQPQLDEGRGQDLRRRAGRGFRRLRPRLPQDRKQEPRLNRDAPLLGTRHTGVPSICGPRRNLARPAQPGHD